jgi:hypothetical protein
MLAWKRKKRWLMPERFFLNGCTGETRYVMLSMLPKELDTLHNNGGMPPKLTVE